MKSLLYHADVEAARSACIACEDPFGMGVEDGWRGPVDPLPPVVPVSSE